MKLNVTQKILMLDFWLMLAMVLLMVVLYELEWVGLTNLSSDVHLVFFLQIVMEFFTIATIPVSLKLLSLKVVRNKLVEGKGTALLVWGIVRLNMLCLPMLVNTFLYYQTMSPAFGYMAIILCLCLFFIYPSMARCTMETEEEETSIRQNASC